MSTALLLEITRDHAAILALLQGAGYALFAAHTGALRRVLTAQDLSFNTLALQEAINGMATSGAMAAAFKAGQFEAGLNQAVDAVDALLARHFPAERGGPNPNELPDAPVVY